MQQPKPTSTSIVPIHVNTCNINNEGALLNALHLTKKVTRLEMRFPVTFVPGVSNRIQARDLALLLDQHSHQLTHILMHNVIIDADNDEGEGGGGGGGLVGYRSLLAAIRKQQKLKQFEAQNCRFDAVAVTGAVSELPVLDTLAIIGHQNPQDNELPDSRVVTALLKKGKLKDLRMTPMAAFFNLADATEFFNAAQTAPRLTRLWCSSKSALTDPFVSVAAQMLENNSVLEDLKIKLAAKASLVPIAQALTSNNALARLHLQFDAKPTVANLNCLVPTLEANFSLRQLTLHKDVMWTEGKRQWIASSEVMLGSATTATVYSKLESYLALNNAGRKELMCGGCCRSASAEDWLSAIAYQEDPSIIFYFAVQNPLLILPVSLGGLIPPPTKDTRARDKAQKAAKNSYLFGFQFASSNHLEIGAARHVKDALLISVRPVKILTLCFDPDDQKEQFLSGKDLAALIDRFSATLEKIVLNFVTLEGPCDPLLEAIRNSSSLGYLGSEGVKGVDFDRVIGVLARLSRFHTLDLTAAPRLSFRGLTSFILKRPIKVIRIRDIDPLVCGSGIAEIDSFCQAVEKSPTLKELSCSMPNGHFNNSNMGSIGNMLRQNSSLEKLQLVVDSQTSLEPIATGLCHNSTMRDLAINLNQTTDASTLHSVDDMRSFLFMLENSNAALRHMKVTNDGWERDNLWNLKHVPNNSEEHAILQKIEKLLAANSNGRTLTTRGSSEDTVPKKAVAKKDDAGNDTKCEPNRKVIHQVGAQHEPPPSATAYVDPQQNVWPMPGIPTVETKKKKKLRPFRDLFKKKERK